MREWVTAEYFRKFTTLAVEERGALTLTQRRSPTSLSIKKTVEDESNT